MIAFDFRLAEELQSNAIAHSIAFDWLNSFVGSILFPYRTQSNPIIQMDSITFDEIERSITFDWFRRD